MGVQRMKDALAYREQPDADLPLIHVAGTNGKGSVSTMIAKCLSSAGYRTGLFTSPHLHRWVERIRVDGRPLSEREAARRIHEVLSAFAQPGAPESTFFELTTLLALETFRDRACDIAVMEVGLGGRLDATNATTPELALITRIARDHTRFLGNTLPEIAREKAGILKPGVPVVVGSREPSALRVIRARARSLGAPVRVLGRDFHVLQPAEGRTFKRFGVEVPTGVFPDLTIKLEGAHQQRNAACAVAALAWLKELGVLDADAGIRPGLAAARWAGRLETVARHPRVIMDAAHNEDGCAALVAHLAGVRAGRDGGRRVLVFGCMRDKDVAPMLRRLHPHFDRVLYCPPQLSRAAPASTLQRIAPGQAVAEPATALARARRLAGSDGLVVVAGSIFLVAALRAAALKVRSDPLIRM